MKTFFNQGKLTVVENKPFTEFIRSEFKRRIVENAGEYLGTDQAGNFIGGEQRISAYTVVSPSGEIKAHYKVDWKKVAPPEIPRDEEFNSWVKTSGWTLNPVDGNLYILVGYHHPLGDHWVGNKLYLYKAPREW